MKDKKLKMVTPSLHGLNPSNSCISIIFWCGVIGLMLIMLNVGFFIGVLYK